ncbi:hypothetical protein AB834_05620 [PVC group bacterium (ex Bugula neritina AB1)]|nr:hypothetical protein AB834_05620 [PVC group bacterium (ex Bugula neritina AB1)]
MKIAIDAMGGDYTPLVALQGGCEAARVFPDLELILVGQEALIRNLAEKKKIQIPKSVSFCEAEDVVEMKDSPVTALRKKKQSSIMVAADLVKNNEAHAVVTAGNTGAAVAATVLKWRLLPGISRPGIALPVAHHNGISVLMDVGANVEAKPSHFYNYAIMGKIYAESVLKMSDVRIGLLNVGEEEGKGSSEIKEIFNLFKKSYFNFIGNVEGRDIFNGKCDVIICDGFVGNIVLKVIEGVAGALFQLTKNEINKTFLSKLGAIFCLPAFKRLKRKVDQSEYGGAILLGVNGVCIIGHGSSDNRAVFNAIRVAREFVMHDINRKICKEIETNGSL